MHCPNCGNNNDDKAQFCYNCGMRLLQDAPSTAGQPTQVLPSAVPPPPPSLIMPNSPNQPPTMYTGYPMTAAPVINTVAIVSLILGIVGWILPIGLIALGAVISGHIARNQIRQSNGTMTGDKLALAGMILGYIQIGLVVVGICGFIALIVVAAVAG